MGKVATTTASAAMNNKRKKKKGRPLKNPNSTPPKSINYDSTPATNRRSTRRNPSNFNSPPLPEFDDGDDDDDERKEKKVKLVVRLPESGESIRVNNNNNNRRSDDDDDDESGSDSDPESEDRDSYAKKRKINAADRGSEAVQEKEILKSAAEAPLHGSPLESGPTTPLPDKKILMFILERLQKKDTYGVFSEPVDPNELPDYFEIIEQPMDFGTVKKKLESGAYKNVEELEADVLLICANAMQYNDADTVYYRQARSIEILAKRDFQNLKHEGDNGEPQPKVVRRGRPPSNKNQKKSLDTSPVDLVAPEPSSVATPASIEDKATGSNSYNLRKPQTSYRYRSDNPYVSSYHSRNGENYSEWLADWNDEFPASILRADLKYGKKHFTVDENRRDTYRQFHPLSSGSSNVLSSAIGDVKRLTPVGLQEPLTYARSLARYAANLGPVAWRIASKKIESAIPAGMQYGPGWVGDSGISSQPFSFSTDKEKSSNSTAGDCNSSKLLTPSTSDLSSAIAHGPTEAMVEAVRKLNSQNEQADAASWRTPFPSQQKPIYQSHRNGFNQMGGFDLSALGAAPIGVGMAGHSATDENWSNLPHGNLIPQGKVSTFHGEPEMWSFGKSGLAMQQRHSAGVPPDLNVRVPGGSPSSSGLQIGSPQQPDLALQL